MTKFRWATSALAGTWKDTRNEALCEAVWHGQAFLNADKGAIIMLRPFASIETSPA
jgi:hypothetical protein